MRVAALYDIHGNLPALEAVLDDIRQAGVDQIVVGGDIVPGPMPRETINCLLGLEWPVQFVHGNGELAMLAQMTAGESGEVSYWGTTSGSPPPEPVRAVYRWTARQLQPVYEGVLASWPKTARMAFPGLGAVLFCHSTPRSETEVFFHSTTESALLPIFEEPGVSVVVCGHTHMQFDRMVGKTRVVNAGSVGSPFGKTGAFWLLLGPEVELRHTEYDLVRAAETIRETEYPQAEVAAQSILQPPTEAEIVAQFAQVELR
jgi:predicted phosphodiesterase